MILHVALMIIQSSCPSTATLSSDNASKEAHVALQTRSGSGSQPQVRQTGGPYCEPVTRRRDGVHRFYDKPAKIELVIDGGLAGFDMGQTCHNLATGGREYWMTQSCAADVGIVLGVHAAQEGLAYLLHRTGHHKLERFARFYTAQAHLRGIVYSKQHGAW